MVYGASSSSPLNGSKLYGQEASAERAKKEEKAPLDSKVSQVRQQVATPQAESASETVLTKHKSIKDLGPVIEESASVEELKQAEEPVQSAERSSIHGAKAHSNKSKSERHAAATRVKGERMSGVETGKVRQAQTRAAEVVRGSLGAMREPAARGASGLVTLLVLGGGTLKRLPPEAQKLWSYLKDEKVSVKDKTLKIAGLSYKKPFPFLALFLGNIASRFLSKQASQIYQGRFGSKKDVVSEELSQASEKDFVSEELSQVASDMIEALLKMEIEEDLVPLTASMEAGITDEMEAELLLGQEGINVYQGSFKGDEQAVIDLLKEMPKGSALLYSERDANGLHYSAMALSESRSLNIYEDVGYDWEAVQAYVHEELGLQLVNRDEAARVYEALSLPSPYNLDIRRLVDYVPEEKSDLLSPIYPEMMPKGVTDVIQAVLNSSGLDIPQSMSSEDVQHAVPAFVDEEMNMEEVQELVQSLITDELVAKLVLGEEGMGSYQGNLDEEYALELLRKLPSQSALLFSSRDANNDLIFVIAARDEKGQLLLYNDDFSQGFDKTVQHFQTLGINIVSCEKVGELMENRWQSAGLKENSDVERRVFLSKLRKEAVLKENKRIEETSTYFLGMKTLEEAENYFKRTNAPLDTALLRYDNSQDSYYISYVKMDGNIARVAHKKVVDVAKAMHEFKDFTFVRNERRAEDFLGIQKTNYCGQMSDTEAAAYFNGASPDEYAMLYSRTTSDGRIRFFAGINKTVIDKDGNATVSFVSYDLGYRPDFDGSWVKFYVDNPKAQLIKPQEMATAEKFVREMMDSLYNHHNIGGIAKAEKLLQKAKAGTVILHTVGEGSNEQLVFSLKLPKLNYPIHRTLPLGAALPKALDNFLKEIYNQPVDPTMPKSRDELFSQFHDNNLVFIPPQGDTKKSQLSSGIKLKKLSTTESSPFKVRRPV